MVSQGGVDSEQVIDQDGQAQVKCAPAIDKDDRNQVFSETSHRPRRSKPSLQ